MGKSKLKAALKKQQASEAPSLKKQAKVQPALVEAKAPESDSESESDEVTVPDEIAQKPLTNKQKRILKKLLAKQKKEDEEAEEEEENEENEDEDEDDDESESEDDESDEELDLNKLAESESESDIDGDEDSEDSEDDEDDEEEKPQEDEDEEDVPLSDVEFDSDADVVPHTKLTVNNTAALNESYARVRLPWAKHSFIEHYSITSAEPTNHGIKDIYDDTERELAFYKQGLDAVKQARATLMKLKVPFSRPLDYFAEMVKSDEHMDKLKTKLLREAADKKASEDAKKQRQLKKFGKQVMHETLQERARQKRETLDKIKTLKKKRSANETGDDEFQIALEEATAEASNKNNSNNKRHKPNGKRIAKDQKYGFGGKKRGMRKNDADSAADIYGQGKKGSGKSKRPGKSKRR